MLQFARVIHKLLLRAKAPATAQAVAGPRQPSKLPVPTKGILRLPDEPPRESKTQSWSQVAFPAMLLTLVHLHRALFRRRPLRSCSRMGSR